MSGSARRTPASAGVVVVGAGQAALQLAVSLRDEGYAGEVVLVGDETGAPYERPPLSKGFLTGGCAAADLELRPKTFFTEQGVDVLTGQRAVELDRAGQRVVLSTGEALPYAHLVLATGARARELPVPGASLQGVLQLRTVSDATAVRTALGACRRLVVIGGGFIGLELAATAAKLGARTTVVEVGPRVMGRVVSEPVSRWFGEQHRRRDVRLLLSAEVVALHGAGGRVAGVATSDGQVLPADLVVVAIGVVPNDELAGAAGLDVADGVVVDQWLRTADGHVSAIGDCAVFPGPDRAMIRLESVQGATDQARCVAAGIAGRAREYSAVPWFWSDQGDLRLQIAGLGTGCDGTVLRGSPETGRFSVFCFRAGRLVAVESVNRPADHVVARRLLAARAELTPEQAADPGFDLKVVAAAADALAAAV